MIMVFIVVISSIALAIGISLAVGYQTRSVRQDMLIVVVVIVPVEAIMIYLFTITRLETVVTSNGLYFRWLPFQSKYRVIDENEIGEFEYRKAPPSHGSTWTPGYGRIHNLGKEGFQFILASGKKYFFSTAERVLFQRAVEQMLATNKKIRFRES